MLLNVSATWPESRFHAASRASTIACLRRISGVTASTLRASIPNRTSTSSGSKRHSTTAANPSGSTFPMIWKASVSTKSSYCDA